MTVQIAEVRALQVTEPYDASTDPFIRTCPSCERVVNVFVNPRSCPGCKHGW